MASPSLEEAVGQAERVWFVIFRRAIDEYETQGVQTHPHLAWLESHYRRARVEAWGDLLLYVYTRSP